MARQVILRGSETVPNDYSLPNDSNWVAAGKINEMTTELYAFASDTISAGWTEFAGGATIEARIALADAACVSQGKSLLHIPLDMLPYDITLCPASPGVQRFREGGTTAGYDASAYGGRQSNGDVTEAIQAALAQLTSSGGGTLDCRGFDGTFILLTADICADVSLYSVVPVTFQWGAHEVRYTATSILRSNHQHILNGTTFIPKDANGNRVTGVTGFQFDASTLAIGGPGNGVITTDGSAVVTKASPGSAAWAAVGVGSPLMLFGFVPPVGHDNTTINVGGGIDAVTDTITVASTTSFPSTGYIRIEDEVINYTSVNATQFLGCVRGYQGTTPAAHANGIGVERCVYQPFYVKSISGNNLTLDQAVDFSSTGCAVWVGVVAVAFTGIGVFDGNMDPAVDDTANPYGLQILGGRFCTLGPGIVFKNHDHGGYDWEQMQDSTADARIINCGRPSLSLGAACWLFAWNKRVNVYADVVDCNIGLVVDDISNIKTLRDGPSEDCTFVVRTSIGTGMPLEMAGTRRCNGQVLTARDIGTANAAIECKATQWITPGIPSNNVCTVGAVTGTSGFKGFKMDAGWANGGNVLEIKTPVLANDLQDGNSFTSPPYLLLLTYSASIAPRPDRSEDMRVLVTNGTAFTITNPTSTQRTRDRRLSFLFTNLSGGAMGAITWDTHFVLAGAFTNPANNLSRRITFRWNESAVRWQEESRTMADM